MHGVDLENWRVRPASVGDVDALKALAALTGGGFTNLPDHREALAERLTWSDESYARDVKDPDETNPEEVITTVTLTFTPDLDGGAACAHGMVESKAKFGGHPALFAGGKGGAVGLAHKSSAGAGRVPAPMPLRRPRRERRFGKHSIEVLDQAGDK